MTMGNGAQPNNRPNQVNSGTPELTDHTLGSDSEAVRKEALTRK